LGRTRVTGALGVLAARPFLILDAELGEPCVPGATGAGTRRYIPIVGGSVSGDIQGIIIPGGGDWQTIHEDGNIDLEAHYAFRAADGAVVEVISSGVRAAPAAVMRRLQAGESVDPCEYYFRTALRFRTGAASLRHLNFRLALAIGERCPRSVRLRVFEVL
jgi:hypothetical protein